MKKPLLVLTTIILFFLISSPLFAQEKPFSDVPDGHQFKAAIDYVKSQKIVNGYPDGTYQPERILNRAEFTKIIMASRFSKALINGCIAGNKYYKTQVFSDVPHKEWFENFVCVAKTEGIIGGYSDGTFKPTNTINFAEASKITVKSYGLKVAAQGDPWFAPFLAKLEENQAVPDTLAAVSDTGARATKQISRGEMADIIFRLRMIQDTVTDSGGEFSLRVPEVAAPTNASVASISISKVPKEENPIQEVNGAPMVFYRLDPPGTKFAESINFEIQIPTVNNTIPMVFFVSGDEVEMIPTPTIEIDPATQIATLTAKIEHFSGVSIVEKTPIEFTLGEPPPQALEDETFTVGFRITWKPEAKDYLYKTDRVEISYDDKWTLFGVTSHFTGALLSSATEEERLLGENALEALDGESVDIDFDRDSEDPDAIILSDIENFFHDESFFCAVPGENQRVNYAFNIGWGYKVKRGDTEKVYRRKSTIVLRTKPFDCITEEEKEEQLGDISCAGVKPAKTGFLATALQIFKPDENPNCYLQSDVSLVFPEEGDCPIESLGPLVEGPIDSLAFDRAPTKLLDQDPDDCHLGEESTFESGLVYINPGSFQEYVKRVANLKGLIEMPRHAFTGVVTIEDSDDNVLGDDMVCDDSDRFSIDESEVKVKITNEAITFIFDEATGLLPMKGRIAQNGLLYAENTNNDEVSAYFSGRYYDLDELGSIKGSLLLRSLDCHSIDFMTIDEGG